MDILVIGGGGREHAIIRKLKQSPLCGKIYCTPGNGGISCDAECFSVSATDTEGIVSLARRLQVDLVVVAPDDPLVAGVVDRLEEAGIAAFGPNARAAIIEGSKVFSKDLMKKYGIPTADYQVFDNPQQVITYVREKQQYPVVIKAEGLALGKGVLICETQEQAEQAVHSIMEDKIFGASGNRVVVEEFLTGPEVSVLAFTDSKTLVPMVSSKDHKRVFDGNKGPNTGGMGTISPNPYYSEKMAQQCMETIFLPTMEAMNAEGRPFKGCLYFGLMLTPQGPKVIEYNCRFGDPETQVVLPRLKSDLLEIFLAIREERLHQVPIEWSEEACACVILASGGYPGSYTKGISINGLKKDGQLDGVTVYHAGTSCKGEEFVTSGGRVLGVTACATDLEQALDRAYEACLAVSFDGMQYRKDIGRIE